MIDNIIDKALEEIIYNSNHKVNIYLTTQHSNQIENHILNYLQEKVEKLNYKYMKVNRDFICLSLYNNSLLLILTHGEYARITGGMPNTIYMDSSMDIEYVYRDIFISPLQQLNWFSIDN